MSFTSTSKAFAILLSNIEFGMLLSDSILEIVPCVTSRRKAKSSWENPFASLYLLT